MTLKLCAIAGSVRRESFNRRLLDLAIEAARAAGAEVDVIDLKALALPVYDGDLEAQGVPPAVVDLKERLGRAHGLLVATPEYNGSIPAVLKNALDWASRPPVNPFRGKAAALFAATNGAVPSVRGLHALRQTLTALGMWLVPPHVTVTGGDNGFDATGVADPRAKQQLEATMRELLWIGGKLAER